MVVDLSKPYAEPVTTDSSDQIAFQSQVDELLAELEAGLEPFKEGHPALSALRMTLVTHDGDFYLPNRVDVKVEAHLLSDWKINGAPCQIVLYREIEDSTVSYGLYNMNAVERPSLAICVILKPVRVKELFIPNGASVTDEGIETGLRNLTTLVGLVKNLAT